LLVVRFIYRLPCDFDHGKWESAFLLKTMHSS
jgi:hypothetical protein